MQGLKGTRYSVQCFLSYISNVAVSDNPIKVIQVSGNEESICEITSCEQIAEASDRCEHFKRFSFLFSS